jgi:hypothetical protein
MGGVLGRTAVGELITTRTGAGNRSVGMRRTFGSEQGRIPVDLVSVKHVPGRLHRDGSWGTMLESVDSSTRIFVHATAAITHPPPAARAPAGGFSRHG